MTPASDGVYPVAYKRDTDALIKIDGLKKYYGGRSWFRDVEWLPGRDMVKAVDGVSFQIPRGDTFGLVGESGCGKSTLGRCLLRIEEPTSGEIVFDDLAIREFSANRLQDIKQRMQIVHQSPAASLNPKKRVRSIITEPLKIHRMGDAKSRNQRLNELMTEVGLPTEYKNSYPNALSGGQKQRVSIARALSINPDFIVLDEPTSALDVSVQARILRLLSKLQNKYNITYLFITHDLTLLRHFADWIGVMYLGEFVELGSSDDIFGDPKHPYTRALLSSTPSIYPEDDRHKPDSPPVQGDIPDPSDKPDGCPFHTRCPEVMEECEQTHPEFYRINKDHYSRCLLHDKQ